MEPHTENDPLRLAPEEETYRALIQDLRALPRAQAPPDFASQLHRRIAATPAKPWWQRVLGMDPLVPRRIPAYAYGAVALVAILAFSLYVYKASHIEQQLQETPRTEEELRPGPTKETPVPSESPAPVPRGTGTVPAPGRAPSAAPLPQQNAPATEAPAERQVRRSVPPQRDADAAKKAATESLRKEENVPAQIKVQEPPYTPALRGIFPVESTGGEVKDSGAARDSLRRADTLKTKRETLHRPPEPRGE